MTKRIFDLIVSCVLLVVLSPVLAAIAITILVTMGRPVFFVQSRPGLRCRPFRLIKFRSMTLAGDGNGVPRPDGERLTRLGRFLRRTSLDELPELVNVVAGDMSLVGPRPLLPQYLDRYTPRQARRHEVKPGITGWAQVNGRNAITWERKFELDVWYVDRRSLRLDLNILFLTLRQVIRRDGISHEGEATMREFMGSEHRDGEQGNA